MYFYAKLPTLQGTNKVDSWMAMDPWRKSANSLLHEALLRIEAYMELARLDGMKAG